MPVTYDQSIGTWVSNGWDADAAADAPYTPEEWEAARKKGFISRHFVDKNGVGGSYNIDIMEMAYGRTPRDVVMGMADRNKNPEQVKKEAAQKEMTMDWFNNRMKNQ